MKLFQIEEPDGTPVDPDAPGVAIGIDAAAAMAKVAVAVGGNADILADRPGFERDLVVPTTAPEAAGAAWQELFEGARLRAERALGQPVTHAVLVLSAPPGSAGLAALAAAAAGAGLTLLRTVGRARASAGEAAVVTAAILAEDLAPRPPSA